MCHIPKPKPGDYPATYREEIEAISEATDFCALLAAQRDETQALLAEFGETYAGLRYGPGKWTVREVAGHLADCERILSYRALRIARGDNTPLASFDQDAYVPAGHFDSRTLADLAAELRAVRQATIMLFRGLPPQTYDRRGTVGQSTPTVAAIAYLIAGHERHHQQLLLHCYLPARS